MKNRSVGRCSVVFRSVWIVVHDVQSGQTEKKRGGYLEAKIFTLSVTESESEKKNQYFVSLSLLRGE